MNVLGLDGAPLSAGYADGSLSPVEVTEAVLAAAALAAERYHAISALNTEDALAAAAASAQRWRSGTALGPLDGVPVTLKDSFHTNGLPRWHGSACHETTVSAHDAAPVRRLREAGAVIIAKTTMPDFAMVMSGLSSRHGTITNPWDVATSPGGSSAGAGACLAAGVGTIALGTDMVGSVRVPAALCGVTALCPSRGRIAYDPPATYRSAGPMARTIGDLVSAMEAVGQFDGADHFALPGRFARPGAPREDLRGVRIGVITDLGYGTTPTPETVAAVLAQASGLADLGAEVDTVAALPVEAADYDAIVTMMTQKGALEFAGVTPERRRLAHPVIAAMLEPAAGMSTLEHGAIMGRLDKSAARVSDFLQPYDYILSPAIPDPAFPAERASCDPANPMSMMAFACWFNQIGAPAGSVPVDSRGVGIVPLSVQVAGRRFDDAGVHEVMALLEARRGFDIAYPLIAEGVDA